MNIYENVVILNASLSDEEINAAVTKIKDVVANSGGETIKADLWGRKKLAYEIKKQQKGFYVLFIFKTPAASIRKLEELYKVYDSVIKFMVIKLGPKQVKALEAAQAAAEAAAQAAAQAAAEAEQAPKEA
ncbi:MAG: 30S ribosomal protein S6 [Nitrospirae bacterium]|nr:30S ribosomal protein S6 [Nitrospirota bacterium]